MALHPEFPESPYAILDPEIRWFPADEALRESSAEKLMPPLVPQLRRKVKEWRDCGYVEDCRVGPKWDHPGATIARASYRNLCESVCHNQ